MEQLSKSQVLSVKKADAAADIALINRYSKKELKPEDVYCFSVRLCDNDVDRDNERFTNATLEALAPLFTGKTGILDHQWSAENQIARLYRVETEVTGQKNSLGEALVILRGSAYMLRTESNQPMIDAIEGGIVKEVSVGCSVRRQTLFHLRGGYLVLRAPQGAAVRWETVLWRTSGPYGRLRMVFRGRSRSARRRRHQGPERYPRGF